MRQEYFLPKIEQCLNQRHVPEDRSGAVASRGVNPPFIRLMIGNTERIDNHSRGMKHQKKLPPKRKMNFPPMAVQ